jgi:DNA repair protein RadC
MRIDKLTVLDAPSVHIANPDDILSLLREHAAAETERLLVLTLDSAHNVLSSCIATMGLVNRTITHPREVFRRAIVDNAVGIVVAHNHPSGQLQASEEDKDVFRSLRDAGEIIGIRIVDFVILAKDGVYSFRKEGLFVG